MVCWLVELAADPVTQKHFPTPGEKAKLHGNIAQLFMGKSEIMWILKRNQAAVFNAIGLTYLHILPTLFYVAVFFAGPMSIVAVGFFSKLKCRRFELLLFF